MNFLKYLVNRIAARNQKAIYIPLDANLGYCKFNRTICRNGLTPFKQGMFYLSILLTNQFKTYGFERKREPNWVWEGNHNLIENLFFPLGNYIFN